MDLSRTLKSKTNINPDGSYSHEVHIGHIHYENKLGLGDGKTGLREIDFTLQWDDIRRGWSFQYHSFQPFIPEYADEWFGFRDLFEAKDQTTKFRPIANHVQGKLVNDIPDISAGANAVIYPDAFGKGIDLIACFSRSSFKRIVHIHESVKQSQDMTFDFEIELPPDTKLYRDKDEVTLATTFTTKKHILIGTETTGYTYLKPFYMWDSGFLCKQQREIASVEYYFQDDKSYLRKIVTKEFLAKSVGDVYTDDSATYYSGTGDGNVNAVGAYTWDQAHDLDPGSTAVDDHATHCYVYSELDGSDYYIQRGFLPFNTGGLPDTAVISATMLSLYNSGITLNNDNDGDDFIRITLATQAATDALVVEDYDQCGAVDNPVAQAADIDIGSLGAGYNTWTFNATGRGNINKTGWTKLGFREGHDCIDSAIAVGTNRFGCNPAEFAGITQDPKLIVTYTIPVNVSATTDALTLTEYSTTVNAEINVSTGVDNLLLAEYSAVVNAEVSISAGIDNLIFTEHSATVSVSDDVLVNVGVDNLLLTEHIANINAEVDFIAGVDNLLLTEFGSDVNINVNVLSTIDALILTEHGVIVNAETMIAVGVDNLTLSEYIANIAIDAYTRRGHSNFGFSLRDGWR